MAQLALTPLKCLQTIRLIWGSSLAVSCEKPPSHVAWNHET